MSIITFLQLTKGLSSCSAAQQLRQAISRHIQKILDDSFYGPLVWACSGAFSIKHTHNDVTA